MQDGNGRVSRLLASIPLIRAGYPPINIRLHIRAEYLQALNTASHCEIRWLTVLMDVFFLPRRTIRQIYSPW